MWRRRGKTGTVTPASRPTRAAVGPAALMTTGAATSPSEVRTPRTLPPATSMASHLDALHDAGPQLAARRAKPWVTSAGPAMPSWGPQTAATRSSTRRAGTMAWASLGLMTRTSTPRRRCSAMRVSKPRRSFVVRDEEEIADLLEAGIDAELLLEETRSTRRLSSEKRISVSVRELGADPAGGLAGGAAAHGLPLEDDDVAHGRGGPGDRRCCSRPRRRR